MESTEASDGESYLCPEIERYITNKSAAQQTVHDSVDPSVRVTVWSPTASHADHSYVYAVVVEIIQWIRSLRWSRYDAGARWTYRVDLTPYRKAWCTTEQVLTKCHVNSGETATGKGRVDVRIIRQEDWVKVLIHETLHAHCWDRLIRNDTFRFPFENEALVEATARVLYCQWLYSSVLAPPLAHPNTHWTTVLAREQTWMKESCQFLRETRWQAQTHIQAYYFCTTALLHNWQRFWEWLWPLSLSNSTSSYDETELGHGWSTLRDKSWFALYQTDSDNLQLASGASQSTLTSPCLPSARCTSLRMVHHQVPVGFNRPRLSQELATRRRVLRGPLLDVSVCTSAPSKRAQEGGSGFRIRVSRTEKRRADHSHYQETCHRQAAPPPLAQRYAPRYAQRSTHPSASAQRSVSQRSGSTTNTPTPRRPFDLSSEGDKRRGRQCSTKQDLWAPLKLSRHVHPSSPNIQRPSRDIQRSSPNIQRWSTDIRRSSPNIQQRYAGTSPKQKKHQWQRLSAVTDGKKVPGDEVGFRHKSVPKAQHVFCRTYISVHPSEDRTAAVRTNERSGLEFTQRNRMGAGAKTLVPPRGVLRRPLPRDQLYRHPPPPPTHD